MVIKPSAAFRLSLNAAYEQRDDNESGYYDRTRQRVGVNMRYAFGHNSIRFRGAYTSRELRGDPPVAPIDPTDYGRTRDGYLASLTYERRFGIQKLPTFVFFEVRYQSWDNSDPVYAYDRGMAVLVNRPFMNGTYFGRVTDRELPGWATDFDCATWAQFSLKYILANPAVTCVLTETTDPLHMEENIGAGFGRFPDEAERRRMREVAATL